MDYHLRKKKKWGQQTNYIVGGPKLSPPQQILRIIQFKECNFCHLYNSIFLVWSNFALQEKKKGKKLL